MIRAILFDRDGTLIADDPGNDNPQSIAAIPGAADAVHRARQSGLKIGVVTNQPGVAEGAITRVQLAAMHERIDEMLGPFEGWFVCPHAQHECCACRKPQPGLLLDALFAFGVAVRECVMIGDIGSDIAAAQAIGMKAILVPTAITLPHEVIASPVVARTLLEAVEYAMGEVAAA